MNRDRAFVAHNVPQAHPNFTPKYKQKPEICTIMRKWRPPAPGEILRWKPWRVAIACRVQNGTSFCWFTRVGVKFEHFFSAINTITPPFATSHQHLLSSSLQKQTYCVFFLLKDGENLLALSFLSFALQFKLCSTAAKGPVPNPKNQCPSAPIQNSIRRWSHWVLWLQRWSVPVRRCRLFTPYNLPQKPSLAFVHQFPTACLRR